MTPSQQALARRVLDYLRSQDRVQVNDLARVLRVSMADLAPVLHMLDDEGAVMMRNGWYWLSDALRKAIEAAE